jgi:hypothetical protein
MGLLPERDGVEPLGAAASCGAGRGSVRPGNGAAAAGATHNDNPEVVTAACHGPVNAEEERQTTVDPLADSGIPCSQA